MQKLIRFSAPANACSTPTLAVKSVPGEVSERDTIQPEGDMISPEGDAIQPEGDMISPERDTIQPEGDMISPEGDTIRWLQTRQILAKKTASLRSKHTRE